MPSLFSHRVGVLATMHQKEQVMAPLLERHLGIQVVVPQIDTDAFGTFIRNVNRRGNQLEAARCKAQHALAVTGETLAFASEGSFGPYPTMPLLACDREIVMLIDETNHIEVVGQALTTETNYSHQKIRSIQEAEHFSAKVGFPEHGLVVMFDSSAGGEIVKGITTAAQLRQTVEFALSQSSTAKVHIETDMRALYNPTRMKVIEQATHDLIRKINQHCPNCACPGFDVVELKQGLRCDWCNAPTALTEAAIYRCQQCNFTQEDLFPEGLNRADPSQCLYCNP